MKNLTATFSAIYRDEFANSSHRITATAIDPETDGFFAAREYVNQNEGVVEVEILKSIHKQGENALEILTLLSSPLTSNVPSNAPQVLSLKFLPEETSLAVIQASGEITMIRLAEVGDSPDGQFGTGDAQVEVVGSVEEGVRAAEWSPDDEQVVLVTGDNQVMLMSRDFEVVYEAPLRTEEFGEGTSSCSDPLPSPLIVIQALSHYLLAPPDEMINVGWGSKKTQFHGSLGKSAAQQSSTTPSLLPLAPPSDTGIPSITWRGDGLYFAISSLDPYSATSSRPGEKRRQVRVYTRTPCALSATSEPIYGLQGACAGFDASSDEVPAGSLIAWRPAGNLIAAVQQYGYEGGAEGQGGEEGRRDVVFLERNGLQHGSFQLREDERVRKGKTKEEWEVRGLGYNSSSDVLAIHISRKDTDVVQLWTMNNYHYYLKCEFFPPSSSMEVVPRRFSSVKWHPEKKDIIYLAGAGFVQQKKIEWETVANLLQIPDDTGTVAVVDGDKVLVTAFRAQNVPPPMSSYQLHLPSPPVHIATLPTRDSIIALFPSGDYHIWDLHTRIPKAGGRGGGKVAEPILAQQGQFENSERVAEYRQVAVDEGGKVFALVTLKGGEDAVIRQDGDMQISERPLGRIVSGVAQGVISVDIDGEVSRSFQGPSELLLFARDAHNTLYALQPSSDGAPYVVARDSTSMTVSSTYLIYTTTTHESRYAPLSVIRQLINGESVSDKEKAWESRRVERGSQIVTVVPSAMSLILQMPRGNLESVNPRPLVLEVVKRDVLRGQYRKAFLTCRRHRIDLNILYDLDYQAFSKNIASFVEQIPEVDYLNLFVSGLSEDDVTKTLYPSVSHVEQPANHQKLNSTCDALRTQLEAKGLVKYVDTILTTHVCKNPPDLEAGLRVLLQLKASNPEVVENAIKYIIFLTNVNQLYDVALGMYDFKLVLMIAQYSQKDPKEYLPFLRELRELDKHYQRFRIDDYLERRGKALTSLKAAGDERFEEAIAYTTKYDLYGKALELWANESEKVKAIYDIYGDYLFDKREYYDAALAYLLGDQPQRAMNAYEKAHAWRELFALASKQKIGTSELEDICDRVSEYLSSHSRHLEAAQIVLDYQKNVNDAVHILCRGSQFGEAFRLIALHDKESLIESEVYPGLEDAHEQLVDVYDEMEGQLDKEVSRVAELIHKMAEDPDSFFMIESEPAMENVDVMTEATTAVTGFTRYTVAQTAITGTSRTSAVSRRKSRKKATGRKGTVDEFEYLLASMGRLAARVEEKTEEVSELLPYLLTTSPEHRELGTELQEKVSSFRTKMQRSIDESWQKKEEVDLARRKAMGEEDLDASREQWLKEQRRMHGQTTEVGTGEQPQQATGIAGVKPVLSEWKAKSKFLAKRLPQFGDMQRSIIAQTSRLSLLGRRTGTSSQVARTAFNLRQTPTLRKQPRPSHLYSSLAQEELTRPKGLARLRFSHVFGGLAILGLFVTTYGLLEWYYAFSSWPEEVRKDLKTAIKARNRGDAIRSEAAFIRAIETSKTLPIEAFDPEPLLKITGIYISLSALLESIGQHRRAIQVLQEALAFLDRYDPEQNGTLPTAQNAVPFTLSDRTRSIGLAQKLGTLALHIADSTGKDKNADLAEIYLTRALNAMIKLANRDSSQDKEDTKLVGRDFDFPQDGGKAQAQENMDVDGARLNKVTQKSMGITMEALADLYVRRGEHELANPLYVQAISTLLPTSPEQAKVTGKPPVQDRCQAVMLMNSLSSSMLNPPSSNNIKAAKAWSLRALQLVDQALNETISDEKLQAACERARIVTEFNLGMLSEVSVALSTLERSCDDN
ncbi:hypothetical protein QFC19_001070 [Naganishia cerealis]|uniref:Uncharacterized protein n=1 Tax=Naganishia cerealis TaxID=610337 RepID=A0ACC2WK45_9TREE|nr:hypothetical protein QFC19_001070 [Naganishia cerealis]